jgi:hypothetical protein
LCFCGAQIAYFHAAFYNMAAYGRPIPDELRGGGPVATGGKKGQYTPQARSFLSRAMPSACVRRMPAARLAPAAPSALHCALCICAAAPRHLRAPLDIAPHRSCCTHNNARSAFC